MTSDVDNQHPDRRLQCLSRSGTEPGGRVSSGFRTGLSRLACRARQSCMVVHTLMFHALTAQSGKTLDANEDLGAAAGEEEGAVAAAGLWVVGSVL